MQILTNVCLAARDKQPLTHTLTDANALETDPCLARLIIDVMPVHSLNIGIAQQTSANSVHLDTISILLAINVFPWLLLLLP